MGFFNSTDKPIDSRPIILYNAIAFGSFNSNKEVKNGKNSAEY